MLLIRIRITDALPAPFSKTRDLGDVPTRLKKMPDDEKLKTNLLNLQNNRKLKMKVYAEEWWALLLERPPVRLHKQMGGGGGKQRRRRR